MPDKLGVLIRGAGWVAGEHVKAFRDNPHTEIKVIDARFEHEIDDKVARYGLKCEKSVDRYEEQLKRDDVEIVSICTISHLHAREAIAAVRAGKHVFVEKPAALTLSDMRTMRDAVRESGVRSAVGFVCHWYPTIKSIKAQIEAGALGHVYFCGAGYWHQVFGEWKSKRELGGSSLLMGGCHAVDLVRWLKGKEVSEVMCYGTGPHNRMDFEYPPTVTASFRFEDGTVGQVSSAVECSMPYVFSIMVVGTRGAVYDDKFYSQDFAGAEEFMTLAGVKPDSPDVTHHPFDEELDEFVACILEDREMDANMDDAYRTHEVVFACERSLETGEPVKLPLE